MAATPTKRTFPHRKLFTLVLLAILAAINVYAFTRPFLHEPSVVMDWRKGPLVKFYDPYATFNAAKIIWPVLAMMLDTYLLVMFLWQKKLRDRFSRRRAWVDPLVGLLVLAGVMVIGEAACRTIIYQDWYLQYRPDPDLFWYNRPHLKNHTDVTDHAYRTTNSLGFRSKDEIPEEKEDNEYRIFIIGDSSTFGLGVNDDEAYAMVIQRTLSERTGRPVRVINSACPGHTTFQGMNLFKRYGQHMKVDLLLRSYNNDSCLDMVRDRDRVSQNPTVVAIQRLLYKSDLYLLVKRVMLDWVYAWKLEKYRKLYPKDKGDWVRRVPFDEYKGFLNELKAMTRKSGTHFLNIRMPLNRPSIKDMPIYKTSFSMKFRNHLNEFCKKTGTPFLNFETQFDSMGNTPDLFIPGHLFHPSVKGHRIIGERIADYIVDQGLMDPPGATSAP